MPDQKVIGKWVDLNGKIKVFIPKVRKVGNKLYPYEATYLGYPGEWIDDIEKDIKSVINKKVKLIKKTKSGGVIITME